MTLCGPQLPTPCQLAALQMPARPLPAPSLPPSLPPSSHQGGDMKSAVPKVADALAKTTMTTVALSGAPLLVMEPDAACTCLALVPNRQNGTARLHGSHCEWHIPCYTSGGAVHVILNQPCTPPAHSQLPWARRGWRGPRMG